jgi:Concanavalin A-like lectin/glucanases superfamily/Bacterial Ig-like domain
MKMNRLIFGLLLGTSVFLSGCKKDEPTPLTIDTIMAGTVDLNTATAPIGVPVNASITVTFSTDLDVTTATSANITLTQDYDNTDIPMDIQASGNTITLIPNAYLGTGALYVLDFGAGLMSTDGLALTAVSRSFTTEGAFAPAGVIAYWPFENSATDVAGDFDPNTDAVVDITYAASRNTAAGQAASFNGSTSLIEIPNGDQLMNTHDFSLCFWVKTNSADKTNGHFVMGLGGWNGFQFEIFGAYDGCKLAAQYDLGDGTSASEDLWFPANGDLGWQGWTFCKDLTGSGGLAFLIKDKWAHIVCVYNSTTKIGRMYINGELMKEQDFNLWPDGDPKKGVVGLKYNGDPAGNQLTFGFIQGRNNRIITDTWADPADPANNHLKGLLDDVRIYHKALTENEVLLMYNSEKP